MRGWRGRDDELLTRWIARVGWKVCVVDQVSLREEERCSTWRLVKAHLKVTVVLVLWLTAVNLEMNPQSGENHGTRQGLRECAFVVVGDEDKNERKAELRSSDPTFNLRSSDVSM
jgi:hypothetical protein